jgi:hypothetical protein
MKDKSLTIVLLILIGATVMWTRGKLGEIFKAAFGA